MRLLTFGHFIVHGSVEFGDPALPVNKVEQARRDDQKQGPLLRGLLIDSHGVAMSANSVAVGGGTVSRHYVSEKTQSSCIAPDRIPAVRLENSVVAVLHRMRLLNEEWSRDELATILRRVVVLERLSSFNSTSGCALPHGGRRNPPCSESLLARSCAWLVRA